jgi:hypothetical protein
MAGVHLFISLIAVCTLGRAASSQERAHGVSAPRSGAAPASLAPRIGARPELRLILIME